MFPFIKWLLSGPAYNRSIIYFVVQSDYVTQESISPVTIFSTRWLSKLAAQSPL